MNWRCIDKISQWNHGGHHAPFLSTNCFRWSTMASSAPKIIARPPRLQGRKRNESVSSSSLHVYTLRDCVVAFLNPSSYCFYFLRLAWSGTVVTSRERWERRNFLFILVLTYTKGNKYLFFFLFIFFNCKIQISALHFFLGFYIIYID